MIARWFSNVSLTSKIVLMVGLLSVMAVMITLYSLRTLQQVDKDYRFLLNNDAQAAILFGEAAIELSLASRVLLSVLTEQESERMLVAQHTLRHHQARLVVLFQQLKPLLPAQRDALNDILQRQQQVFTLSAEVVSWAARWRGDKALNIIHEQYDPALVSLKNDLLALHSKVVADYQKKSDRLNTATQATLVTSALAFAMMLIVGIGLAGRFSLHYFSYPVSELTRVMRRLTRRDYPQTIEYTQRQDEIGQMAQALEVFSSTMQKAERLERAEATTKAKAVFLANISHEIRTPMNAILGMTRQVLKHPLEPAQRQRLTQIEQAGTHLHGIISDLLDFSRLDQDRITIKKVPFSPASLMSEVQIMVEQQAQQKGLSLHVASCEALPGLWGDPLRIKQILLNYLSNAIKFSDQGEIHVSLRLEYAHAQEGWLYAEVTDQGQGIAPEHQERLFSPFEQLPASSQYQHEGTGLGLAICRRLAGLMDGETGVISDTGKGSTFWCRVKVEVQEPADTALSQQTLAGKRLLVVDDAELNLLVVTELLQEAGIRVDTAGSGEAALALLEQQGAEGYDGVLLDLIMPGLDGLETCRRIRRQAEYERLPVIALSANDSPADRLQCFKAGMNGHIAKPIDEQQLWQVLADCLHPQPVVNAELLGRLQQRLPAGRFAALIQMTLSSCEEWQRHFTVLAESGQWQALREQAHNMAGTAGQAGLVKLSEQARLISVALKEQDEQRALRLASQVPALAGATAAWLKTQFAMPDSQD